MNLDDLKKPFPPEAISWRVGSTTKDKSKGMALAYIDARDVQDRLDQVCGIDGWQCRYIPMHDKKTVCEIGIRIEYGMTGTFEWIWKSDGAGDSDVEAEKGALSDAFKRAAVRWGIGRYLYDLDSPWVEVDTYERDGKVFVKGIKSHEITRLQQMLAGNVPKPSVAPPDKPKMTPAEWATNALANVTAITTDANLSSWIIYNSAAIEALGIKDGAAAAKLKIAIKKRKAELEEV